MNKVVDYMSNMLNGIGGGNTPEEPSGPEMPEGWDEEKVNAVESADGVVVPVPKGYTASSIATENKVSEGFVIYEGEEAVNDSNKETAQTTRNQFVWVPVEEPSEMYGTDTSRKKWGKLYEFSADGITPLNWTEQDGVMTITSATGYREPDVVTYYDGNDATEDSSYFTSIIGNMTGAQFKAQLENEFNNMIDSVERYGGFYIGRYETGNLSQEEAVVVKNNSDINNQNWYTMYNKAKGISANSNVTTTMIWGCQWDATLRWMYNSGNEAKKMYTYHSTDTGNHSGVIIPTGSNESYAVNNIYDMEGNEIEWTLEVTEINNRIARGGYYTYGGDSASNRNGSSNIPTSSLMPPTNGNSANGSRTALYIM